MTAPARRTALASLLAAGLLASAAGTLAAGEASAASLSTWDKVAACESGGNWSIVSSNGLYYGGLQFSRSTWLAYGGGAYAPYANQASKQQQILVAEKVLAGQGQGAWPRCGPAASLGADHADPYPSTTTPPPAPAWKPAVGDGGSVTGADGTAYTFSRSANGHVQMTARLAGGGWTTADLTNVVGTPAAAGGSPAAFVQTNGTVGVATANADNGHLQITYRSAAGTWATSDLTNTVGTPTTGGAVSASTDPDGTLAIYSRGSVNGNHLSLTALQPNGAWATVDLTNTVGTPASAGGAPSTFTQTNGTVGVATANADNGHLQITYKSAAGTWATSDLTGTAGTPVTDGAVSASTDPDGTLAIYSRGSVNGNHLSLTALQPSGAWATVDLTNTVGTPASAGGAPSTFTQTNGTVGVATANADNGHLQITYKSAAGTWATTDLNTLVGTPATDGAVSASTDPDGTLAIYSRGSLNGGHLNLTALQPNGAWATVDLTNTVGTPAS
ncbi:transglycosylase family protein [Kitasatospora sp. NPDC048538]|uniref:transglycosylase family protein n=1 Tax=unclassified Kitasatospora TaxID=2633591 RepID=UPI0033CAFBA3